MNYPKLVVFKTKHCDFRFLAQNDKDYKKIGLKILLRMKENYFLNECHTSIKYSQKEYLEDIFSLSLDEIDKVYRSTENKFIILQGKETSVRASGFETPEGKNVIAQVNLARKRYQESLRHNKQVSLALKALDKKDEDKAWSLVEYFGYDSIEENSFDSFEIK